jgi:hypothetical protein
MRITQMINQLQKLYEEVGEDVEVLITDGFQARCYRGDFAVEVYEDIDGTIYADIGIGGCEEG